MAEAPKRPGRPRKNPEAAPKAPVSQETPKPAPKAKKSDLPALLEWRGRKPVHAYEQRNGQAFGVKINPGDVVECHEAKTAQALISLGAKPSDADPSVAVRWSVYTV